MAPLDDLVEALESGRRDKRAGPARPWESGRTSAIGACVKIVFVGIPFAAG
jgi:hypothetical protein